MRLSKQKRDRLVLVAILTVAFSAGVWQLLIQANMGRLAKAREMETAALKKFEQAQLFLQGTETLENEALMLSNELARAESMMANRADPYAWSYQLITTATNQANVKLELREITRPQAPGPVGILPDFPYDAVSFEVRGLAFYEDLGRFLVEFENRYPFFQTRNLQIGAAQESDEGAGPGKGNLAQRLSFRMDVVALVQPSS
jgi:hypothetical protein